MDSRRRLVSRVRDGGLSVSAAAREAGVSRQTAHLWLTRAQEEGLALMKEKSRCPKSSPRSSSDALVQQVLKLAEEYPYWGPLKLHALLWPQGNAPVCQRTVARILARRGRRVNAPARKEAQPIHFERSAPNELWQIDFKKLGHRKARADSLSVIDDAARFCLALRVVSDQTLGSVWDVMWSVFGEFGLPREILSDNGPAFRNNATWRWSSLDLRLMLLGVKPIHGRPYHPQTQGKVERLHGTIEREISFNLESAVQEELELFRNRYNWVRPHMSLSMRTPGSVYNSSPQARPSKMPEPFFPEGAAIRRCSDYGVVSYKGIYYKLGRAFTGFPVGILNHTEIYWGTFHLGTLSDLKV